MPAALPLLMRMVGVLLWIMGSCASAFASGTASGEKGDKRGSPQKIVSLNLCTDQIVMMLVERRRIASISFLSRETNVSAMAAVAAKLPINYGKAEEVFMQQPDLVLVGSYTTRSTVALLRRLGRNVVEVPPASSFEGIYRNIAVIGKAVGETPKALQLIKRLKQQLAQIKLDEKARLPVAALYFANGYSSGANTLIDKVVRRAGLNTLGAKLGFSGTRKLSLEALIFARPDLLIVAPKDYQGEARAYEVFRHPAMAVLKDALPVTSIASALTICGTPHTVKAIKKLAQFRQRYFPVKPARGELEK